MKFCQQPWKKPILILDQQYVIPSSLFLLFLYCCFRIASLVTLNWYKFPVFLAMGILSKFDVRSKTKYHFSVRQAFYIILIIFFLSQLLGWLVKKLPNEKKLPAEFKDCIAPLFSCLEDRNGGVRDAAKASVQYFMAHLGYEAMSKATAKLDVSISCIVILDLGFLLYNHFVQTQLLFRCKCFIYCFVCSLKYFFLNKKSL